MIVIVKSRQIELTASADDWGLPRSPGREATAEWLNQSVMYAVGQNGATRWSAFCHVLRDLHRKVGSGAARVQSVQTLDRILDQIFGESA